MIPTTPLPQLENLFYQGIMIMTKSILANYFLRYKRYKVIIVMTFQSCFTDAPFPAKLIDFMLVWSCVYCQEVKNKATSMNLEKWILRVIMTISSTLITKVDSHFSLLYLTKWKTRQMIIGTSKTYFLSVDKGKYWLEVRV